MSTRAWTMLAAVSLHCSLVGCGDVAGGGPSLALADFSNTEYVSQQRPGLAATELVLVEAGLNPPQGPKITPQPSSDFSTFFEVEGQPGRPVIIDGLIGQVNGQPIYADEVLGPLMDRLRANYDDMPHETFQQHMFELIEVELQGYVENELIVAESRAELSSEEQTGLLAFMDRIREDAVRKRGGVRHEAERRLLEEEGKTIDEYIDSERQKLLISELLRDKIASKTLVSWRDIERAYRAGIREFQPPATVTLGRIRLKTAGNEERIQSISEALAAGEPFGDVAAQAGMADHGLWQTLEMPASGITGVSLASFYTPHLEEIQNGGTSPAFEERGRTYWIHLLEITRPPARTLDDPDVQRMLQKQLMMARSQRAEWQYVHNMLQRGIHDEIDLMVVRAYKIASSRFPQR